MRECLSALSKVTPAATVGAAHSSKCPGICRSPTSDRLFAGALRSPECTLWIRMCHSIFVFWRVFQFASEGCAIKRQCQGDDTLRPLWTKLLTQHECFHRGCKDHVMIKWRVKAVVLFVLHQHLAVQTGRHWYTLPPSLLVTLVNLELELWGWISQWFLIGQIWRCILRDVTISGTKNCSPNLFNLFTPECEAAFFFESWLMTSLLFLYHV